MIINIIKEYQNTTWILPLVISIVISILIPYILYQFYYQSSKDTNTNTNSDKYGVSITYNTKEGRSYPYLGHALTFIYNTPWDVLTLWHQNNYTTDTIDSVSSSDTSNDGDNNDTSSSSFSQQQQQKQQQQIPILCFKLMNQFMFSISSSYYNKFILQSKVQYLHKDIYNTMKPFLSILGTGIVSSNGTHWLQQRLKMSHPLRNDILNIIPYQTLLAIQRLFTIIDTACLKSSSSTTNTIPINTLLRHLTLQVISSSFLSLSHEESDLYFAKLYLPIVDECNLRVWYPYRTYMFLLPYFWYYHYNVYQLNQYVSKLIKQRYILRRNERNNNYNTSNGTSTTSRRIDILDKILQVYEDEYMKQNNTNSNEAVVLPMKLSESIVRQVRDEMKTFMLAGHETSAALMTWTIYELLLSQQLQQSQQLSTNESNSNGNHNKKKNQSNATNHDNNNNNNKSLYEQVCYEANTIFDPNIDWLHATEQTIPSMEQLSKLMFIESCLKETLRKYSVVPIATRYVIQDLYIPKENNDTEYYYIPKGSTVLINIQSVHLDPTIWNKPMLYDPYRFITLNNNDNKSNTDDNENKYTFKEIEPYTYLPFIAGPRNCLGQHLALLETKMVIALLLQRYNFTLPQSFLKSTSSDGVDNDSTTSPYPTSWSDPRIFDPRHPYMVPIIPKEEIMLSVSRK